jgi:hypothetical protein
MAIYPAATTTPIAILNSANNQHNPIEIPLSAIYPLNQLRSVAAAINIPRCIPPFLPLGDPAHA